MITVHASAVVIGETGVLIRGPSGAGKSDLALRLIDGVGYGLGADLLKATLVADDQVVVQRVADQLLLSPPARLAGKIELRGIGIVALPYCPEASLDLVIDLADHSKIDRMPPEDEQTTEILGFAIRHFWIDAKTAGAAAKIRALVR
ncbi:MAG: HPr kinase/phosphatase C-terminal domain-containing protein [Alphaproteobacteria bacterium]|nr:HPr kinase/phosphatase C-terminal domain-containing protein [Alphaproteobacteria bacterium]